VNRRELLSKIGLAALLPVAVASGMATEPKVPDGEWYLNGAPVCPDCGMMMNTWHLVGENGEVVIRHPKEFHVGDDSRDWKCKNAGKTFSISRAKLPEYHGKVTER
jgi:hypothetical protein